MKRKFTIRSIVLGVFLSALNFLVLNTAYAGSGGPDTYGYTYSDSNGGSATYSWISHTGGATTVGGRGDDNLYGPYNVGFTFNFYGNDYTTFYICNNGFVTFSSGNCGWTEVSIPTSGAPDNFIAPFWDDLYTAGTIKYELFGSAPNQYMVISYEQIDHISATGGADFQIILYETSNNIQLQYADVTFGGAPNDSGASATVGIENSAGTDGLQFSYDSSSLSASLAIKFTWPTPTATVAQSAYRFFQNANSTDVGTALAAADTATTLNYTNQPFRLRMLLHIGGMTLTQSTGSYKLQYVGKGGGTCASPSSGTPSSWTDVTTGTDIAFYDNATPTDASALTSNGSDPTHSGHTVVNQTYEEGNNFSNSQALIASGQDGKWDFALYDKTADASTTYCFRIVNSGGTALDTYSVYPELTTKTTTGGPDTFGYRWYDCHIFGEACNSWTDISATGTAITGRSDDSMSSAKPIGFTFNFYGNSYTDFYLCNNGFISFSNDTCAYVNATIITAGTPNNFIAPFWDDLYTAGNVYYETIGTTPNKKLIISFNGINPYATQGSALSFQVVLHETNGEINIRYNDVDYGTATYGGGLSATVGIENSSGTDGLLYSYLQSNLSDNYSITFKPFSSFATIGYRFFANNDGTSVVTALAAQDTAYTLTSDGDAFRVRLLLYNMGSLLGTSGESFKLQYIDRGAGTCLVPTGTSPSYWTDITASTDLAYKDNATPTDGSALTTNASDPSSGNTRNYQTYEELNNFTNSQSTIPANEDGMWDFALYDKSVSGASTFCLRVVTSTDKELLSMDVYPEITTAAGSNSITFSLSTNSISFGSLSSTASTAATPATVSVTSNAANGFQVYIKGEGNGSTAGLFNGGSSLISAAASTSVTTSGTPGFGVYAENASAGITIDEGFDNDSSSDLAVSRSYQKVFSTTAAGGGAQTADLRYKAVVDSLTTAGSYTENIDVIVFGSF